MSKLFSPVKIGKLELSHRVVLAPMTRLRSDEGDVPSDMMVDFYAQRASQGGLLIAEAPSVSAKGRAYSGAPGIFTDEQEAGWKKVADAVHDKGAKIFLQLWHAGRQSHVDMQPDGGAPIAPSAIQFEGVSFTRNGWVPVSPNRALELDEIAVIIEQFRSGAKRALRAGFDGVELHAANGYVPDQFLQDGSNQRTDAYGGSVENRARFLLEATTALIAVWGADRVGVRISPSGEWGGVFDSDPDATFAYVAAQLDKLDIAYLHVIEPRIKGDSTLVEGQAPVAGATLKKVFKGTIIAAGGFDRDGAEDILQRGDADLVAFGRPFAANPDLPRRYELGLPLNHYKREFFWGGSREGYTDYPTYAEQTT
jgi:N-ethylmaleimide reductase